MKKLFFTLAICLFSLGAFASNNLPIDNNAIMNMVENVQEAPEVLDGCTQTTTVIVTIKDSKGTTTITVTYTGPCD